MGASRGRPPPRAPRSPNCKGNVRRCFIPLTYAKSSYIRLTYRFSVSPRINSKLPHAVPPTCGGFLVGGGASMFWGLARHRGTTGRRDRQRSRQRRRGRQRRRRRQDRARHTSEASQSPTDGRAPASASGSAGPAPPAREPQQQDNTPRSQRAGPGAQDRARGQHSVPEAPLASAMGCNPCMA